MDEQVPDEDVILADREGWQRLLDDCPNVFSGITPGRRIGILVNENVAASIAQVNGIMLVWRIEEHGASVEYEHFERRNLHLMDIDLLVAVDEDTMKMMHRATEEVLVEELARRANHGQLILFFMIDRDELEDHGYYEFLEVVGLSFLGPCR